MRLLRVKLSMSAFLLPPLMLLVFAFLGPLTTHGPGVFAVRAAWADESKAAVTGEILIASNQGSLGEEESFEDYGIPDPLEGWNRVWFRFNDWFYFNLFKPAAQGYGAVVPEDARIGVFNFFDNLYSPVRVVSALLQGRPQLAGRQLGRFIVNSSVGLGGFFDVAAQEPELKRQHEDLGQAFGRWGIGHGFYLVWPFLGPMSLRDSVGRAGELYLHPVSHISLWVWNNFGALAAIRVFEYLNEGSLHIGDYEDLIEAAIDPYVAVRDAYYQRRKREVEE